MKRILLGAFGFLGLFTTLTTATSCNEDNCKAIVCANGGVCEDDGACTCPVGFEGERCETVSRDKFIGVWTVTEDGSASSATRYAVSVEQYPGEVTKVWIRNFNNQANAAVMAQVNGDTIVIPSQTYTVGQITKTVDGIGIVKDELYYGEHGQLSFKYIVRSSDGVVDDYGYDGGGTPSEWVK